MAFESFVFGLDHLGLISLFFMGNLLTLSEYHFDRLKSDFN